MRSKIAANLNVLEFVKIFGEICKTLGVRWSNRYGVTAPLQELEKEICPILHHDEMMHHQMGDAEE